MEQSTNRIWDQWYIKKELPQLPEEPLYEFLKKTEERYPDRLAILFEQESITYRELKKKVDLLAGKWESMNFSKGERIGLMMNNHPAYIICYYAAQALGLTVVQINPFYTSRELLQILTDSTPQYIVFDETAEKTVREVETIYSFSLSMSIHDKQNVNSIPTLIKYGHTIQYFHPIDVHEDVAVIQYTGGTSGKMKGAMLTHYNLTSNVLQSHFMYGNQLIQGQETVLAATPLYHVYGMTSAMNLGIYLGATILLIKRFEIKEVLEQINSYQPTFFPGVPKMYNTIINYPGIESFKLNCFKICSSGSAPLPIEVLKRFEALTGVSIGEGFGLSEASPSTHRNPPFANRKVGSIGIPLPLTDCMIIDENNQSLEEKYVGELLIKGPQVMKGYWNNPIETERAIKNGWLYTGDLAIMDEDGYFYIVGRKKEMIIVNGFNIYPQEVEGILYEHPDVKEAAVVGIPDEVSGEVVKAYVVPKENVSIDLEEVKGYCYSKLTHYKVPKEFEIRNELPRNTVGKLLKRMLIKEELSKKERNS
ncbi:long-chain-fatty-acid--CoA ligase [Bacillus massilinigeriensis]|uniref:long-chain-fatty-acid--CoA ligase n=1 Tax=Bacillus massilionigeriensis TaxID=1805475 RepID=UPI00096B3E1E|nr:long-chain fatty acid--CoA ligase [Bacillus massilionigeriensis]